MVRRPVGISDSDKEKDFWVFSPRRVKTCWTVVLILQSPSGPHVGGGGGGGGGGRGGGRVAAAAADAAASAFFEDSEFVVKSEQRQWEQEQSPHQ